MNLGGTEYTLKNKSFDIYISGCTHNCSGCFNKELHDFNYGTALDVDYLVCKILDNADMIDKICIFGGDICCQDEVEAFNFLTTLSWLGIPIVVYTGKSKGEIWDWLWDICSAIKCGRFILEKRCKPNTKCAELFGSTNQIYYYKEDNIWKYKTADNTGEDFIYGTISYKNRLR